MTTSSKQEMIAADLAAKIHHHQYQAGDFLPSEHQLCTLYGTSRETVRKALEQLTQLGLIQKIKGRGSIVLDLQRYTLPVSGITSFKELAQLTHLDAETKLLTKQDDVAVPPALLRDLGEKQATATKIERLRIIDGTPAVLDQDYLLTPPAPPIPDEAAADSLYNYLENECHFDISYATKTITVEQAPAQIAAPLALQPNDMVVVVRSTTYLADTTPFQLTASYHRPEKFRFLDFARRQKLTVNH